MDHPRERGTPNSWLRNKDQLLAGAGKISTKVQQGTWQVIWIRSAAVPAANLWPHFAEEACDENISYFARVEVRPLPPGRRRYEFTRELY